MADYTKAQLDAAFGIAVAKGDIRGAMMALVIPGPQFKEKLYGWFTHDDTYKPSVYPEFESVGAFFDIMAVALGDPRRAYRYGVA